MSQMRCLSSSIGAELKKRSPVADANHDIGHGDVVIAAITSCTNTSNPSVLIAAGLMAMLLRRLDGAFVATRALLIAAILKLTGAPGAQQRAARFGLRLGRLTRRVGRFAPVGD